VVWVVVSVVVVAVAEVVVAETPELLLSLVAEPPVVCVVDAASVGSPDELFTPLDSLFDSLAPVSGGSLNFGFGSRQAAVARTTTSPATSPALACRHRCRAAMLSGVIEAPVASNRRRPGKFAPRAAKRLAFAG
jgi:hypothetical protein